MGFFSSKIKNGALRVGAAFNGARMLRQFKNWVASQGSPDGEIIADLPKLRYRCRDLHKNNAIARAAEEAIIRNVVGPGLKMQTSVDYATLSRELNITPDEAEKLADEFEQKIESAWHAYYNSTACDARGVSDGPEKTRLALSSVLQSGDVFATFPRVNGYPRLGLIEADQVQNPLSLSSNAALREGVFVDENGAPLGYYVNANQEQWPQDMHFVPKYGNESGRAMILHLFREERPGQNRGIPWCAPAIEQLKNLDGYKKSEITAALVSSFLTFFVEKPPGASGHALPGAQNTTEESLGPDFMAGPAAILELPAGWKMNPHNPARPNSNAVGFIESVLKEVGSALGVPFEMLLSHYTTSFTSARAARIEFWKTVQLWRSWLVENFLRVWYEEFLTDAIIAGRVDAPGFFTSETLRRAWAASNWYGPALGQINEKVETEAIAAVIALGGKSASAAIAEAYGTDYEDNIRALKREQKFREKHGVRLSTDESTKPILPQATPPEEPTE
jgi:lambda family phage portal protein